MIDKIAIVTSGFLPVPATKGGAVENLIVNILNVNEKKRKKNFLVYSIYDEKAIEESKKYKYTTFKFIKPNFLVLLCDKIVHYFAKNIFKKKNSQSYRYIIQRLYFLKRISKDLKKNDYKKVLLENHPTQYLCLKWHKNYLKYEDRYFYHCHNEFPGTYGCEQIIKSTKKIICVSEFIANNVREYMDMNEKQFTVLRNCVDTNKFLKKINDNERKNICEKYNIKEKDKIILFTGRITPEKGVRELICSLKNVKNENYKVLILGAAVNDLKVKTTYEKDMEKAIEDIKEKVIFTGFVKYDDIYKFYKLADIAVLPSMWNDPAPLTIIESMVCGLPIITTDSGGIPEYATSDCAIILNRDKNLIKSLASSIDELLYDDEKRKQMSENAINLSRNLTLQNYYNNLCIILEKID